MKKDTAKKIEKSAKKGSPDRLPKHLSRFPFPDPSSDFGGSLEQINFIQASSSDIDLSNRMRLIDERYKAENRLLEAISSGDVEKSLDALLSYGSLMNTPRQKSLPRSPSDEEPLRDFKNSVQTMNTLFRKAVEGNHVHPIYIHAYSSRFARQIEETDDFDKLSALIYQMLKKYCYLAANFSLASYSRIIRSTLLYIEINLCSQLTTKSIAAEINVSPNYLSSQFHKETGTTILNYIRDKRIHMAVRLLNTTDLSIQSIADQIGIGDCSYFSKQFKAVVGLSPAQYRKNIQK